MSKKTFLVETVTLVKKQYVVYADDMIEAQDSVVLGEISPFDRAALNETIVSTTEVLSKDGAIVVPNADPIKEAKRLQRDKYDYVEPIVEQFSK